MSQRPRGWATSYLVRACGEELVWKVGMSFELFARYSVARSSEILIHLTCGSLQNIKDRWVTLGIDMRFYY